MTPEVIGKRRMNINLVKSEIKPWMDKEGNERYYIGNLGCFLDARRNEAGCIRRSTSYDWDNMRASPQRVAEIIESNILAKTKAYIDKDGFVHIYGYATVGKGEETEMCETIENAINFKYGFCNEEQRMRRLSKMVYEHHLSGKYAKSGDTVQIIKGRKEVGRLFKVAYSKSYSFSRFANPSITLYSEDGFRVSAENCEIRDLGYSF